MSVIAEDCRVNQLEYTYRLWQTSRCSQSFVDKCDLLEQKLRAGIRVSVGNRLGRNGVVASLLFPGASRVSPADISNCRLPGPRVGSTCALLTSVIVRKYFRWRSDVTMTIICFLVTEYSDHCGHSTTSEQLTFKFPACSDVQIFSIYIELLVTLISDVATAVPLSTAISMQQGRWRQHCDKEDSGNSDATRTRR
jgi:hypothetical protein